MGKGSLKCARVSGKRTAGRGRGVATDISPWKCETCEYYVTIANAPGP